jgi:hypothetical protein
MAADFASEYLGANDAITNNLKAIYNKAKLEIVRHTESKETKNIKPQDLRSP